MTQSIFFDVIARDKASSTFSRVGKSSSNAEGHLRKFGRTAATLAGIVGGGAIGAGFVSFLKDSIAEGREAQKVGALTTQVIKSTGGAANVTAGHVGNLANAISKKIGVDDEAIQSGENLLLTFKNIRNEAGKGNKIFDQATRAATDLGAGMAAASGGTINFKSATTLVGKALNDPIKGLTALRKVGVDFTKGQQDQIKKLVDSGQRMKAQKIILKELKSEFGGAAKSQATDADKARVAWKNLEEQVGTAVLPTVDKLARLTSHDLIPAMSKFITGMQDGTGAGGDFADILRDVGNVGKTAVQLLNAIPGPVKKFGIEGLIAFAALQKLTSVTSTLGGKLGLVGTEGQRLSSVMSVLGGAARQAAGVGGMMLLAKSTTEADSSARTLESTLGGAAAGFAAGGPVGGAIGALAGFTMSLANNTDTAARKWKAARDEAFQFGKTLHGVTAKVTAQTDAQVLSALTTQTSALPAAQALGLSQKTLIKYVEGNAKAQKKVNDALVIGAKTGVMMTFANGGMARASDVLTQALGDQRVETGKGTKAVDGIATSFKKQQEQAKSNARKIADYKAALAGLPKKVVTELTDNKSAGLTLQRLETLIDKYGRTPKQVRTLVAASGLVVTDAQMKTLIDHSKTLGQMKPTVNVSANTQRARTQLSSFYNYLVNVTKSRTVDIHTRTHSGRPGGVGGLLNQGVDGGRVAGGRGSERALDTGMRGAATSTMKVKRALEIFDDKLGKVTDRLSSLRQTRSDFLNTFQSDNLFGADLSGGGGASALVSFEQQQASQAAQLLADIKNVASRGLSKALISQLQAQGTSGAEALHALATGSTDQIRQLNSLNAQTTASLQAAGLLAGNTVRGGNINADINSAAAEDARIERILKKLRQLQGDDVVVIQIDSETIIKAIKRRNKRKGVSSAGV